MKNVIKPSAKGVLIPLGLTAAVSAADAGIHENSQDQEKRALIRSNDEVKDIIKIS